MEMNVKVTRTRENDTEETSAVREHMRTVKKQQHKQRKKKCRTAKSTKKYNSISCEKQQEMTEDILDFFSPGQEEKAQSNRKKKGKTVLLAAIQNQKGRRQTNKYVATAE